MRPFTYLQAAILAAGMADAAKKPKLPDPLEPRPMNPEAEGACAVVQGGEHACGPNGCESWLNRGLETEGGWNPPYLNISSLVTIPIKEWYAGTGGDRCENLRLLWNLPGKTYNIPPILLAVLGYQESACDPLHRHYGVLRCKKGTCPNGDKKDKCEYPLETNADCAARNLRRWLDDSNDNIIYALGKYDDWFTAGCGRDDDDKRFTTDYRCSDEGRLRNEKRRDKRPPNLSFIHDTLNGWLQGHNLTDPAHPLRGKYSHLGNCTNT
ncbi:hypothetical protein LLEC1_04225 [Akanthomyces lecanii]|uniref:Uncharacterized protein n=1 Tax=Cordyceps confragosa TaxID=2714763 RepID=A0A179I4K2_CORDF|nr:hypothetical protein LLEC1_04225 [Akanthomyces lecanii]